jgi:hypothetical protein
MSAARLQLETVSRVIGLPEEASEELVPSGPNRVFIARTFVDIGRFHAPARGPETVLGPIPHPVSASQCLRH